jgi:hypothetical protein
MEAQKTLLTEYLTRDPLPETMREELKTYQRLLDEEITLERRMDGNRVREIVEESLTFQHEVFSRMGLPPPCAFCPDLDDDRRPPRSDDNGCMDLRCGHHIHIQCFLNIVMKDDLMVSTIRCPVCDSSIMDEAGITFFRRRTDPVRGSVLNLWRNNATFRTEFQELCKQRASCMKICKETHTEIRKIVREFHSAVDISVKTIRLYKKEYSKRIVQVKSRRKMLYQIAKYSNTLTNFTKRYELWTNSFRALRGLDGVPRIPEYMNIPFRLRRSLRRYLRVTVNS